MPFRVEWASAGRCWSARTWMTTKAIALVLTKVLAVHLVPVSTRLLQQQGRGKSRQLKVYVPPCRRVWRLLRHHSLRALRPMG
ncbi:hypothetical protein PF006_g33472 [Phytophthora fragariae]|uniref:Uncharacterized protein n=1 Tax=Phytophthora fragariae TaxID=53985 RepID=A0A6A3P969_9STRA|nr:hypothetical protein PF006_g33472 [Phytophthora fragariae]